jgi:hypothetical protein
MLPGGNHPREIIRMNKIAGVPSLQFLHRLAKIFEELAVDKVELTCGVLGADKAGNSIDNKAEFSLCIL